MSEQEFDLYLKLLSRCLSLTSQQREQIADELRDHLEERLQELARAGVPREKAVFQALDEFGDAAVLAAHFSTIAHLKRRRFLMRLSLGSVAALAAALLVAFAFWPENRAVQGPAPLFAQNKSKPTPSKPEKADRDRSSRPPAPKGTKIAIRRVVVPDHPLSSDVGENPRIEEALDQIIDFQIDLEPLKDALDFIAQRYQIPILLDTKTLEDASIDTSTEVKMPVTNIKLRNMLKLLLEQLPQPLIFDAWNGVLRITTVEKANEHHIVVVYDCRDLIHLRSMNPEPNGGHGAAVNRGGGGMSGRGMGGGAMFDVDSTIPQIARQFGGGNPNKAVKKTEQKEEPPAKTRCAEPVIPLIRVIEYAGDRDDWQEEDGSSKITEIGGLIVVNQTPVVHEQIKKILADLRRMRNDGAFATLDKEHAAAPATASKAAVPKPVTPGAF